MKKLAVKQGSLWSNKQRSGNAIHETPYYGSFQPSLPEFFIENYTEPGQRVLDPFGGRGTTGVQAALMGRIGISGDITPYASCLHYGKNFIAEFSDDAYAFLETKLMSELARDVDLDGWEHLLPFFHPDTLREILYLCLADEGYGEDRMADQWVCRMACMSILTGHSDGHLSVKTMPPNVQVSADAQKKLNKKNSLQPEYKTVGPRVIAKLNRLVADMTEEDATALRWKFVPLCGLDAKKIPQNHQTPADLVLFSPPFLDVIDYVDNNWIRNEILDGLGYFRNTPPAMHKDPKAWSTWLNDVMGAMCAVVKPGGHLCVEAGIVRKDVNLIDYVKKAAKGLPLEPQVLYINEDAAHTRTAKTWGVDKEAGTNSQQVLVFRHVP